MCTGAIPADRLPCRYPSVRMMAVCKSSGDENPCRKTRFPRSKPPSENPLGVDPVACPDGTRAVREHLFRFLVGPLFPQRENGIHAGRYPAGTNVKPYWQPVKVAIGEEMPMRPITVKSREGISLTGSSPLRLAGEPADARTRNSGRTLGAKVHNYSVTVWRNGSILSRRFCARLPPCVCS